MPCYPDVIVSHLGHIEAARNQVELLETALQQSRKISLCDVSVWHNAQDASVYKTFQDVAYLNYDSPVSLLSNDALLVLCVLPISYASYLSFNWRLKTWLSYILEVFLIILPSSFVLLEVIPPTIVITISIGTLLFNIIRSKTSYPKHNNQHQNGQLVCISLLRALIALKTLIAIMAVDFSTFPRRYAKSESFGVSIMDVGVGTVIFSAGIVRPRDATLKRQMTRLLPVVLLGMGRLIFLSVVSYHVTISEYGIHWNFFFSIVFSSFISEISLKCFASPLTASILLLISYQFVLSIPGVVSWIFLAPRTNIFSSNREGILSCFGFSSIYLIGFSLGSFLKRGNRSPLQDFCLFFGSFWIGIVVEVFFSKFFSVYPSRRLANLPYCVDVISLCSLLLAVSLVADWSGTFFGSRWEKSNSFINIPILNGLHKNQLAMFLIGNLLVGLMNLSIRTLLLSPILSAICTTIYVASFGIISTLLSDYSIQLRL